MLNIAHHKVTAGIHFAWLMSNMLDVIMVSPFTAREFTGEVVTIRTKNKNPSLVKLVE
jgi:regulator of RNase E activity RraA